MVLTRRQHIETLRDILSAFPKALSKMPADAAVHKAQRAVTVLDKALEELAAK